MASFRGTAIVSEIRGSVGNVTYSRNRGGMYSKVRKAPANPNTALQQLSRARISNGIIQWRLLSQAQMLKYDVIAEQNFSIDRLGRKTKFSGYTLFLRHYIIKSIIGQQTPSDIAAPIQSPSLIISDIFSGGGILSFNQFFRVGQANVGFFFYASTPRSASIRSINPSQLKYLTVFESVTGTVNRNITALWEARFGPLNTHVGKITTIGFRTVATETAQLGTLMCFNVVLNN